MLLESIVLGIGCFVLGFLIGYGIDRTKNSIDCEEDYWDWK